MIWKCFLPFHGLLDTDTHETVLSGTKVFNFDEVKFFLLLSVLSVSYIRSDYQIQCSKDFVQYFLLRVLYFYLLHLGIW